MPRGASRPPSQRQLRVGEEIRHLLANLLERGDIRDPELAGRIITVTEVRISPDLRNATAFVVPLGGGDPAPVLAGLRRARSFLRHEIAKSVDLRVAPFLSFEPDTSFDEASRIEALLRNPLVRRDVLSQEDDDQDDELGDSDRPRSPDSWEGEDDGA